MVNDISPSTYEGTEPYIFVSYAHKNAEKVLPVITELQKNGFRIWFDKGIEAGSEWPAYIESHLKRCNTALVFMSSAAVDSINCRNEINYALMLKKQMLIVYLEETELLHGMGLQLSSVQSMYAYRISDEQTFYTGLFSAPVLKDCRDASHTAPYTPTSAPSTPPSTTYIPPDTPHIPSTPSAHAETSHIPSTPSAHAETPQTEAPHIENGEELRFELSEDGTAYICVGMENRAPKENPSGNITVPSFYNGKPVTDIGDGAFRECNSLCSIVISEGIVRIGRSAFFKCAHLVSVSLPSSIQRIETYAFLNCTSLKGIEIPIGVTSVENATFAGCSALASVVLPYGIATVGERAFSFCTSLTSILLPKSVTYIGEYAFGNCRSLKTVSYDGITQERARIRIEKTAFVKCRTRKMLCADGRAKI